MTAAYADPAVIRRLLHATRTWAMVGLSDQPARTVHEQARLLQARGKRIIPIHPKAESVLGEPGYPSLADVPSDGDGPGIDVVGVYRRADSAGAVVDEAIAVGAKAVWLPLGVIDEAAAQRARDAGLDVVMDRCPAVEWALRY